VRIAAIVDAAHRTAAGPAQQLHHPSKAATTGRLYALTTAFPTDAITPISCGREVVPFATTLTRAQIFTRAPYIQRPDGPP
jgi:hypothetical protein